MAAAARPSAGAAVLVFSCGMPVGIAMAGLSGGSGRFVRLARWAGFDRAMTERSVRFTLTVMAPILLTLVTGPQNWLVYAMVAGIVAFAGDAGGPPLARLGWMATGPLALAAGLAAGAAAAGNGALVFTLAMGSGLAYGLVETAHPHLLLATRFFTFGIVLAGLVSLPLPVDYLAILIMLAFSWVVSLASDRSDGSWQPLTVPPAAMIGPSLAAGKGPRIAFAVAVSLAIGAALAVAVAVGSVRPTWTCLTVVLVMRSEVVNSLRQTVERVIGTLGGVIAAVGVADFANHRVTVVVMALAAFVRWPAQQFQNALGVFCLTLFVLLMVEIVTPDTRKAMALLGERLTDTLIGAVAASIALLAYWLVQRVVGERKA